MGVAAVFKSLNRWALFLCRHIETCAGFWAIGGALFSFCELRLSPLSLAPAFARPARHAASAIFSHCAYPCRKMIWPVRDNCPKAA